MKNFLIIISLIILVLFISGYTKNEEVLNKECINKGFIFKNQKVLNYRTGKSEMRYVCVKDK